MLGLYKKLKNECYDEERQKRYGRIDIDWLVEHKCKIGWYEIIDFHRKDNEAYILRVKDCGEEEHPLNADVAVFQYFDFDLKLDKICTELSSVGMLEVDVLIYFWYIFMEDKGIPFSVLDKSVNGWIDYFEELVKEYSE